MSKTKHNYSYKREERDYYDGEHKSFKKIKSDVSRKKKRRLEHALKTGDVSELLELEELEE
jgi:hypothetical protein